jgi:hypothetical protein
MRAALENTSRHFLTVVAIDVSIKTEVISNRDSGAGASSRWILYG